LLQKRFSTFGYFFPICLIPPKAFEPLSIT
jgi:hypothetical protein